jgi:hypothetical protein
LVEEVPVDIYAVGLGEVLGDQLADGGEVGGFLGALVLHIVQVGGVCLSIVVAHTFVYSLAWCCWEVGELALVR